MANALDSGTGYTPSVIRGESPAGEILIDDFSVTIAKTALDMVAGKLSRWTHTDEEIIAGFQKLVNVVFGRCFKLSDEIQRGFNGFDLAIKIEGTQSFVTFGGNNIAYKPDGPEKKPERFQIKIHGEQCPLVEDWARVAQKLRHFEELGHEPRITRIDLACDIHDGGKYNVDYCRQAFSEGRFKTRGRPPTANYIDDLGSKEGRTFYVGKRESDKYFRCYEKGRQLGDKASEWVRWEVELKANDRVIPFDVLENPRDYLAGCYPALSWVSRVQQVIRTCKEKAKISYLHARYWARTQYGKLLHYAERGLGLTPEQAFLEFFDPSGFPERLIIPAKNAGFIPHEVTT